MAARTPSPVRPMVTAVDALVIVLVLLTVAVRMGPAGWLAGIAFAVIGWAVLTEGLRRFDVRSFSPAGRLILARAVLVGGVTALVVETTDPRPDPTKVIAGLAAVAWVLTLVSMRVARPAEPFDKRFAAEVDAFHLLVLSAFAATRFGVWVMAFGLLYYAFRAAKHRPSSRNRTPRETEGRRILPRVVTGLAGILVLVALVGPNQLSQLTLAAFARIPIEGLMGAALVLILPTRARKITIVVIGAGLGLLTIVKMLDMGFYEVFDRPFHPVFDWSFLGPAVDFLNTSIGGIGAVLAVIGVVLLVLALLVLMVLAVRRLSRLALGHRTAATNTLVVLGIVWIVCALSGAQLTAREPVASRSAADHVYDDVLRVRQGLLDGETFAAEAAVDHYRYTPGDELLTALRGKDVLFVFVESYGRVAIEDSSSASTIDPILDVGTDRLRASGFDSRSAFLTSPTFGGGSWFAHSTLQTGLWVENAQRYASLATLDRMTLSIAFNRAGWRTVGVAPAITEDWPEGEIYHYDKIYDAHNVGYRGPKFSYATMPDQYTLQHFERTERAADGPVMAEIDLVSSHTPYAPLPDFVDWKNVGDGSVYDPMPAAGQQPGEVWPDPTRVRTAYTSSIAYSLKSLLSYIETYGDDDLVTVFMGDHQPQPIIASQEGSRDVPISIVTRDPAVLARVADWRWSAGLNPSTDAPVMRMDKFRDRFLSAYGPKNDPGATSASPR